VTHEYACFPLKKIGTEVFECTVALIAGGWDLYYNICPAILYMVSVIWKKVKHLFLDFTAVS
jgi:hypothetical protein